MGKLNLDLMRQSKAKLDSQSGGGAGFAKLAQGKNIIRVLWPKGDSTTFYSEGFVHFGLGVEGKNMATCPKTFDEHNCCPICEYVERLQKSKDKSDQDLGSRLKRRKRVYINVLCRDAEEDADEPKVLPIGVTVLKPLLDTVCDSDYGDITDPNNGRDVTITRKGQMLKTEYTVLPKPVTSPASTTYEPEELESKMADLDSLFKEQTYDELSGLLHGDDEDNDEPKMEGKNAIKDSASAEDYDEMELDELKELCAERGIKLPEKISKFKLIMMLTQYDEEQEESDDIMNTIGSAIESRKKK